MIMDAFPISFLDQGVKKGDTSNVDPVPIDNPRDLSVRAI